MAERKFNWVHAALLSGALVLAGCDESIQHSPAGFSPAHAVVRSHQRVARCNTVHSLTLPAAVISRYGLRADDDTGVISCALQIVDDGVPANTRALISGTARNLTGRTVRLGFKEVLDRGAVSYVATFSLTAASRIDFDVQMYDPITGERYEVKFQQTGLPGRLSPQVSE